MSLPSYNTRVWVTGSLVPTKQNALPTSRRRRIFAVVFRNAWEMLHAGRLPVPWASTVCVHAHERVPFRIRARAHNTHLFKSRVVTWRAST